MNQKTTLKFVILILFIVLVIYFFRFSEYSTQISFEHVKNFVESFGVWSFLIFILVYAILTTLSVPGLVLTFTGAILFGTLLGTLFNLIGATIGAGLSFYSARYLGRGFVEGLLQGKLKELDKKICDNAFEGVLFLRLIPLFPFIGINFGAGLCKISFKDFITATFIGMIPGTFVYTYLFASLGEKALSEGLKIKDFLTLELILPIILFILLLLTPTIHKRWKK